ncbi:hypothetical protein, partial [uncultured Tenacibaculum sp.]|uniref:hypothetical protein n=1 Tax=uncultured Tenacibaculum sp. TaxID=174713 RepID=UPI0026346813
VATNGTGVFNGQAVGSYTVEVNYGSGCTTDIGVVILDNQEFTATAVGSSVLCNGDTNGEVTITATNFGASFEYNINGAGWITGNTTSPLTVTTGLGAGSYTVEVRSSTVSSAGTQCVVTVNNVSITEPSALTGLTANVLKEVTCDPATGATIEGDVTGGTPPYTYDYQLNGAGAFITSLTDIPAGTHTIRVTDDNGCTATASFTINNFDPVVFTATPVTCYDGTNGEIAVNITSGDAPFRVRLDSGAFINVTGSTHTFTGLGANTYAVEVVDNKGCTDTVNATILPQLTATAVVTDASCSNGEISITPVGGSGGYTFSAEINAATPAGAPIGTFSATNPIVAGGGTYDVFVRDSNGCTYVIEDVVVDTVVAVGISLTDNQPACNGDNGSIDVTISNGRIPHTITLSDSGGLLQTINNFTGTSLSFPNLPAETYTVDITDGLGCTDSQSVTLTDPPLLTATILPERPTCGTDFVGNEGLFGYDFTGFPTVSAPNKIQFSSDNGATWQDSPTFRGTAGNPDFNYGTVTFPAIRITDIATESNTICFTSLGSFTMPFEVSPLVVNITTDTVDCTSGATAVVTVDPMTGVGPFEYTYNTIPVPPGPTGWQPAGGTTSRTFTFTNLVPGRTYFFFVRDLGDNNCTRLDDTFIIDIDVVITPSILSQSCNGGSTGSLQFDIDDSTSNQLNGGVPSISWELFTIDVVTGAITSVETGTQSNLDPIVPTSNGTLAPGTYYVEIENNAGTCTFASPNVEILETAPITANLAVVENITCSRDGVIRVENVTGGTPPYTFTVATATNFTPADAVVNGNVIEFAYSDVTNTLNPVTGITVTITDSNGNACNTTIGPVDLTVSQDPTFSVTKNDNACNADLGEITVNVTGATTGNYTATLTGALGSSFTLTGAGPFNFTGLVADTYTVAFEDTNGCSPSTQNITINPDLDFDITPVSILTCAAGAEYSIEVSSGTGSYSYEVDSPTTPNVVTGTIVAGTGVSDNFTLPLTTPVGTYTVRVTDTGSGSCVVTKTFDIVAPVDPAFTVNPV